MSQNSHDWKLIKPSYIIIAARVMSAPVMSHNTDRPWFRLDRVNIRGAREGVTREEGGREVVTEGWEGGREVGREGGSREGGHFLDLEIRPAG